MKVKKLHLIALSMAVLLSLAGSGGQITTDLELADPPWCYPGSCNLLADDYPNVSAQVIYNAYDTSFSGSVAASGMLPNTLYQFKLEGKPTCKYGTDGDDQANSNIGYIGRWWNDTDGWNEPSDAAAEASMAAGDCVLGYVLFDCATSDGDGNLNADLDLDYSWHVCGVTERGAVELPNGDYNVKFVVTENHQWWRTVLTGDVQFTVDHWMHFKDIGSGDGLGSTAGNWSDAVCPTDTGGNYGGIATDPDSPDKECRTVWGPGLKPRAHLSLRNNGEAPTKLVVRVLDGQADDSFDVYIRPDKQNFELVYSYESDPSTSEYWVVHEIPLDGEFPLFYTFVEIRATGDPWEHFDTYGQLAVDWIGFWW